MPKQIQQLALVALGDVGEVSVNQLNVFRQQTCVAYVSISSTLSKRNLGLSTVTTATCASWN